MRQFAIRQFRQRQFKIRQFDIPTSVVTGGGSSSLSRRSGGGDGGKLVLHRRESIDDGYDYTDGVKYLDEEDEMIAIILAELTDW